jgi:catechol 2,3-dioxygenase-like lactoylglutathione lyase family enzyme
MIHHFNVQLRRDALTECVDFYESLGFVQVEPPAPLGERSVWMELDGAQVHLEFGDVADGVSAPAIEGHIALVLPELETIIGALERVGVNVEDRNRYWGSRRVFVHDPVGTKLELMQYPPGGSPPAASPAEEP